MRLQLIHRRRVEEDACKIRNCASSPNACAAARPRTSTAHLLSNARKANARPLAIAVTAPRPLRLMSTAPLCQIRIEQNASSCQTCSHASRAKPAAPAHPAQSTETAIRRTRNRISRRRWYCSGVIPGGVSSYRLRHRRRLRCARQLTTPPSTPSASIPNSSIFIAQHPRTSARSPMDSPPAEQCQSQPDRAKRI